MSCQTVSPSERSYNATLNLDGDHEKEENARGRNEAAAEDDDIKYIEKGATQQRDRERPKEDDGSLVCRVCDPIDEELDEEVEEEAERQRPFRDPGMPSRQEILEHNLTHIPPRPWCPHCVRGKGKDSPSLRLRGEFAESLVPRIRLDYCFLNENYGDEDNGEVDDAEKVSDKAGNC